MFKGKPSRVSPFKDSDKITVSEYDNSDWDAGNDIKNVRKQASFELNTSRRRRSYEAGTEEYADYVEKRIFNIRESWTPFLWQRIRDKRKLGGLNPTKGWEGWKYRQRMRWNSFKYSMNEWTAAAEIWRDSLKQIEGHQGTGVVSYFVFLKFILFLNVFIFLTMFIVVVFFEAAFDSTDYTKETTGLDNSSAHPGVSLAESCTANYSIKSSSGFQNAVDFFVGTGWMEKTAMFYGYYSNRELSNNYNMPFAYVIATITVLCVSLGVMLRHIMTKYMDTLMTSESERNKCVFFHTVFNSWDYRVSGEKPVQFQQTSFYHLFRCELEELKHMRKKQLMGRGRKCLELLIRVLINVFIIGLLIGSAVLIYITQEFSSDFTTSSKKDDYNSVVVLMVQFLPSIIIVSLNGVYPILFTVLAKVEDYKPSTIIRVTTLRIVFVRLAALIVISTTIYREVTCSTQDSCLVGTGDCPAIQCWESYFGQQIYKLVMMEFLVDTAVTLGYELPRKVVTTKFDKKILKKIGPAEFDIPINVLDLVYTQTLCWLGFYFAPLLPVMVVLRLILLFYLRKLSALYNCIPPEKPYQATRSNAVFVASMFVAFLLVSFPIGYVLVKQRPSPMCGPFRIYNYPTDIVDIQVDNSTSWFSSLWGVITSSAFVALAMLMLSMSLYYCYRIKGANTTIIAYLKKQVIQDGKDKEFLLEKINRLNKNENRTNGTNNSRPNGNPTNTRQINDAYSSRPTDKLADTRHVRQANDDTRANNVRREPELGYRNKIDVASPRSRFDDVVHSENDTEW